LYKKNLFFCKKMFGKGIFGGKIDRLHQSKIIDKIRKNINRQDMYCAWENFACRRKPAFQAA
jgi:hypothetical protein